MVRAWVRSFRQPCRDAPPPTLPFLVYSAGCFLHAGLFAWLRLTSEASLGH